MIAKRGFYGAFLENSWDLIRKIVEKCHKELKVPVTCKIRVFDDVEKTVNYAKMIEKLELICLYECFFSLCCFHIYLPIPLILLIKYLQVVYLELITLNINSSFID